MQNHRPTASLCQLDLNVGGQGFMDIAVHPIDGWTGQPRGRGAIDCQREAMTTIFKDPNHAVLIGGQ